MEESEITRNKLLEIWNSNMKEVPHWSLYLQAGDLVTEVDSDRVFSGASMIKTFVLRAVLHHIQAGRLQWSDKVLISEDHLAVGDGLLRYWASPQIMELLQVCGLMINVSDNAATNAVVDHIGGIEFFNDTLSELGYSSSRLRGWVGGRHHDPRRENWKADPSLPTAEGLSVVTAREHGECVDALMQDRICSGILRGQNDSRSLARHVVSEAQFAHKTGTIDGVRHDGGRIELADHEYLDVHVLTDGRERPASVDDLACRAMASSMRKTLKVLGYDELVVGS